LTADYRSGFLDGFVDYTYAGGTGEPPPVPPRTFWNVQLRSLEGKARVNQWFAGYRHGARMAASGGYRALATIHTSFGEFAGTPPSGALSFPETNWQMPQPNCELQLQPPAFDFPSQVPPAAGDAPNGMPNESKTLPSDGLLDRAIDNPSNLSLPSVARSAEKTRARRMENASSPDDELSQSLQRKENAPDATSAYDAKSKAGQHPEHDDLPLDRDHSETSAPYPAPNLPSRLMVPIALPPAGSNLPKPWSKSRSSTSSTFHDENVSPCIAQTVEASRPLNNALGGSSAEPTPTFGEKSTARRTASTVSIVGNNRSKDEGATHGSSDTYGEYDSRDPTRLQETGMQTSTQTSVIRFYKCADSDTPRAAFDVE
jgi:hypothetical protein